MDLQPQRFKLFCPLGTSRDKRQKLRASGAGDRSKIGVKTGHPSARASAQRRVVGLVRAVSFVAVILALALEVPRNRGEDHATMCAPHLPSPRAVRH